MMENSCSSTHLGGSLSKNTASEMQNKHVNINDTRVLTDTRSAQASRPVLVLVRKKLTSKHMDNWDKMVLV